MPIIDIVFENEGQKYTYVPHNYNSLQRVTRLWARYIHKHFKTPCSIVEIKVTKLRTEE